MLSNPSSPQEALALAEGCRACELTLRAERTKLDAKIRQLCDLAEAYQRIGLTHRVTAQEAREHDRRQAALRSLERKSPAELRALLKAATKALAAKD